MRFHTLLFTVLLIAAAFASKSTHHHLTLETETRFEFEGKSMTLQELNDMLQENKVWPKDMKERYSRRVTVGGPECNSYSSCRNFQESKDAAYCFASAQIALISKYPEPFEEGGDNDNYKKDFGSPGDNTIYYAETMKKTGSPNDFNQYLFARLPIKYDQYFKSYKATGSNLLIRYKPFLFT